MASSINQDTCLQVLDRLVQHDLTNNPDRRDGKLPIVGDHQVKALTHICFVKTLKNSLKKKAREESQLVRAFAEESCKDLEPHLRSIAMAANDKDRADQSFVTPIPTETFGNVTWVERVQRPKWNRTVCYSKREHVEALTTTVTHLFQTSNGFSMLEVFNDVKRGNGTQLEFQGDLITIHPLVWDAVGFVISEENADQHQLARVQQLRVDDIMEVTTQHVNSVKDMSRVIKGVGDDRASDMERVGGARASDLKEILMGRSPQVQTDLLSSTHQQGVYDSVPFICDFVESHDTISKAYENGFSKGTEIAKENVTKLEGQVGNLQTTLGDTKVALAVSECKLEATEGALVVAKRRASQLEGQIGTPQTTLQDSERKRIVAEERAATFGRQVESLQTTLVKTNAELAVAEYRAIEFEWQIGAQQTTNETSEKARLVAEGRNAELEKRYAELEKRNYDGHRYYYLAHLALDGQYCLFRSHVTRSHFFPYC